MYAVVVNEGPAMADDNAVLFSDKQPRYEAVPCAVEGDPEATKFIMFVVFTPTNGPRKGHEMRVPISRIVSVSEEGR